MNATSARTARMDVNLTKTLAGKSRSRQQPQLAKSAGNHWRFLSDAQSPVNLLFLLGFLNPFGVEDVYVKWTRHKLIAFVFDEQAMLKLHRIHAGFTLRPRTCLRKMCKDYQPLQRRERTTASTYLSGDLCIRPKRRGTEDPASNTPDGPERID